MSWRLDNAGQEPEVGDYVAYNWSGQIATGFVLGVGRSKFKPSYKIHQVLPARQEGHISRVLGGAKCLLILEKKEIT